MIWYDTGYLLSKNKYSENSLICEIFTKDHGKISGIIFGGTSKKIKNYLQIGNRIHVNFSAKTDSSIGYFKVEIEKALSPIFFDDNHKLLSITSAMQMIRILTADSQKNNDVFLLIEKFYELLRSKYWVKEYIYWELELLKILGYDFEIKKIAKKEVLDQKIIYVAMSKDGKKVIPNYLIDKSQNPSNLNNLVDGFNLVGEYLNKTILKPNNLSFPISRLNFINSLKSLKFH